MSDDNDRWPVGAETICDRCGERRVCQFLPNPFVREVSPEAVNPPQWWCRPCYVACAEDV